MNLDNNVPYFPQNVYVKCKPIAFTSDANLHALRPIRGVIASAERMIRNTQIVPIESPILRPIISHEIASCARRRNILLTILISSLSVGVYMGRLGAKTVDDFDDYLVKIKEQEQMDPYR